MTKNQVIVASSVLPADVREHARAFYEANALQRLVCGYVDSPRNIKDITVKLACRKLLGKDFVGAARRPAVPNVPGDLIDRNLTAECRKIVRTYLTSSPFSRLRAIDRLDSDIARSALRHVSRHTRMVFAREMAALEVFRGIASEPIVKAYQLPIAYYGVLRDIIDREIGLFPDVSTEGNWDVAFSEERNERKDEEIRLSDVVVVPSSFVERSLRTEFPEVKTITLPFGTEPGWCPDRVANRRNVVLHVGRMSVRKGTHRLLAVWKRLGAHRTHKLRIIGGNYLSASYLRDFAGCYEFMGRMPRAELRRHYLESQFSVLPALAEGFAVVLLESLSTGTPIIASRNSGAEGFIEEGSEGLLHDAQNDDQLAEAIELMLSNPQQCAEMSANCLAKARSWTWGAYRQALVKELGMLCSPK